MLLLFSEMKNNQNFRFLSLNLQTNDTMYKKLGIFKHKIVWGPRSSVQYTLLSNRWWLKLYLIAISAMVFERILISGENGKSSPLLPFLNFCYFCRHKTWHFCLFNGDGEPSHLYRWQTGKHCREFSTFSSKWWEKWELRPCALCNHRKTDTGGEKLGSFVLLQLRAIF